MALIGSIREARDVIAKECNERGGAEVMAGMNSPLILQPGTEFILGMRRGQRDLQALITAPLKQLMMPGNFFVGFYIIPQQTATGVIIRGG